MRRRRMGVHSLREGGGPELSHSEKEEDGSSLTVRRRRTGFHLLRE